MTFKAAVVSSMPAGTLMIAGTRSALHSKGTVNLQVINVQTPFRLGDIVTRHGTDLQRVISPGFDLITVECVYEPLGYLEDGVNRGEPWCRVGDIEDNMSRRYSLVEASDALEPDRSLAWLDIVVPDLLRRDWIDAMAKLRLAARWAEAKADM